MVTNKNEEVVVSKVPSIKKVLYNTLEYPYIPTFCNEPPCCAQLSYFVSREWEIGTEVSSTYKKVQGAARGTENRERKIIKGWNDAWTKVIVFDLNN